MRADLRDEKRQFFSLNVHWRRLQPVIDINRHLLPVTNVEANVMKTSLRHVQYPSLKENARPAEEVGLDYN
jgi:hypothetical protein